MAHGKEQRPIYLLPTPAKPCPYRVPFAQNVLQTPFRNQDGGWGNWFTVPSTFTACQIISGRHGFGFCLGPYRSRTRTILAGLQLPQAETMKASRSRLLHHQALPDAMSYVPPTIPSPHLLPRSQRWPPCMPSCLQPASFNPISKLLVVLVKSNFLGREPNEVHHDLILSKLLRLVSQGNTVRDWDRTRSSML